MKGFQKLAKHNTKIIGLVVLSVGVLVSIAVSYTHLDVYKRQTSG